MKIIKTANGKSKVKMSQKEWQSIGKTAGWDKADDNSFAPAELYMDEDLNFAVTRLSAATDTAREVAIEEGSNFDQIKSAYERNGVTAEVILSLINRIDATTKEISLLEF